MSVCSHHVPISNGRRETSHPARRLRSPFRWSTIRRFGLILVLAVASGCRRESAQERGPSFQERKSERPWVTATSLEEGRRLHEQRCLSCHGQAPRALYDAGRWKEIVESMAERSGLDSAQSRLVLDWILVGDSLDHHGDARP